MTRDPRSQRLDLYLGGPSFRAAWLLAVLAAAALLVRLPGRVSFHEAPPADAAAVAASTERIDPNTASAASLQRLPGIGEALAAAIVEARADRPFARAEDLARVRNIGPVTVRALQEHLTFAAGEGRH
jgi:competence protein ComEA